MIRNLRNSLRLQLVVLISLLALASAGVFALLASRMAQAQIELDQFSLQRHLATRMAAQLAQDMVARSQEMRFLASMQRLRDPARTPADKQDLLLTKKAAYPIYAWIGLTDTGGHITASTEPRLNGADVTRRSWFQGGSKGLHFEDIHEAVLLGKLLPRPQRDELPLRLIDVSLPLNDEQDRFLGVLAAHLSLDWTYELRDKLLDELEDEPLEMVLVNRTGDVIIGSPSLPAQQINLSGLTTVRQALQGQAGAAVEAWPDGQRYLTTAVPALGSAPFPGLGWVVIVRTEEGTAFAGARRLTQDTMLAGLAAALIFSGLMWWLVGRQLRPLERLSTSARQLLARGLAEPLPRQATEAEGDGEVAVFTRSLALLVNALRDSQQRFQGLFEQAPVAMVFANRSGDVLNFNSGFVQLFGTGAEGFAHIDQWFHSAFPEGAPRDKARQRWERVLALTRDAPVELPAAEYEVQRTDGTRRMVSASAIAMPDGVLVAFHDQTERRQAEASLGLWAEAFERSEVGFMIADVATDTIIAANPAFARQRGYEPTDMVGMPIRSLYPQRAIADLEVALATMHQQGHLVFESEHITGEGRVFPVQIDATVMRDAQGRPTRRVASVQDLTARRLAEQEIQRLHAELEQRVIERTAELSAANRELDSFAYSVSHDLRAPLRTVNGFVQVLQEECAAQLDASGNDYLQRIQSGTRRMGELIEGLLALSRHSSKPLERQAVNLSALAERRLAELAAAEPAREVTVQVELDLVADCDPSLAEAVLVNLLDNAWKYSSKTPRAYIRFHQGEVRGLQGFCVSDNGAGFDMARATRLFEPFQRLHPSTDFAGTGVGLATVLRIVDRHGGRIVAQAESGQGACFCFTLRPEA